MTNYPLQSPVNTQNFVWVADYIDGTAYTEFDFATKKPNHFKLIDKDKILRFGLVGCGAKLFYEVFGGTFNLAGQMIEVLYKTDHTEYYLTGRQQKYTDMITYKEVESFLNLAMAAGPAQNQPSSHIYQYNFGYKTCMDIEGIHFQFKAIVGIPFYQQQQQRNKVHVQFRLVADRDVDGYLCMKQNGRVVDEFVAPLKANVAGELNWVVK